MTTQGDAHWIDCIRAFLHDPPDKALDVMKHEERACRYLAAALDIPPDQVRDDDLKAADWLASAIERLPLPKGTLRDCEGQELDPILEQPFNRIPRDQLRRSSPINGGDITNLTSGLREAQDIREDTIARRAERIRLIAQANPAPRQRAYAIWRLLPAALPAVSQLPGDTRLTDHCIIDHADAAMAACAALREGRAASLLVFSLGPVQDFIVKGRSLRDLWTGSYLLSWLTFHAMVPILQELGPWCITSPGLRGNPLCDWWLGKLENGQEGVRIPRDDALRKVLGKEGVHWDESGRLAAQRAALRCASLPNVFTALVPTARAEQLCTAVREACTREWRNICGAVERALFEAWKGSEEWRSGWDEQCANVWDIRCLTLPFVSVTNNGSIQESAQALRKTYVDLIGDVPQPVADAASIAAALRNKGWAPSYVTEEGQGLWMLTNDLAQRVLAAHKQARLVPAHAPADDTREKCALFPGFAVMGPVGDTRANKDWWRRTVVNTHPDLPGLLRPSERLSAPGLVKRFAFGAYFSDLLGKDAFPDTREAAFKHWVEEFRKAPNGVLHWENWRKTVDGINRRAGSELENTWAYYELLDEGALAAANWLHPAASEEVLRRELDKARRERSKLVRKAREEAGLPDPKPYYAVLVADGDQMGAILRGERGAKFADAYHPTMRDALKRECQVPNELLQRVRPLGLASQLAFSRALGDFTQRVQDIVDRYHGTCVYAGGDDVLAVLPVATALPAAADIAQAFATWVPGATLSAGVAIVHCHDDLRSAIATAREAEQAAKRAGRNALAVSIARRSGDTTTAVTGWSLVRDWYHIAGVLAGQSDRWVHHLLVEREVLRNMSYEVAWNRAKHHLLHGEEGQRRAKGLGDLFDRLRETWASWAAEPHRKLEMAERIDHFLTWCQHAAWLARFFPDPIRLAQQRRGAAA